MNASFPRQGSFGKSARILCAHRIFSSRLNTAGSNKLMDSEDWMMALLLADAERRRGGEQGDEEMEELREEYDEWCIDHGIDPPPRPDPEVQRGAGCLCVPATLGFLALIAVIALYGG